MAKFLALMTAPAAEIEKLMKSFTPESMKVEMEAWNQWMSTHAAALADQGGPLGKSKRVQSGTVTDVKNELTGYMIIEAESLEAAAAIANSGHPHLRIPGATIEVVTIMRPFSA